LKKKQICETQTGNINVKKVKNQGDVNQQKSQDVKQTTHETNKIKPKNRRFMKRPRWKKVQDKKKSREISAVYNYSKVVLTEDMKNVLSKGLNFCVTPEQIA
jgi:hypothetical protein